MDCNIGDFKGQKERFKTWWDREETDRPLLTIFVRRRQPRFEAPEPAQPADVERQWMDPDYRIARFRRELAMTDYVADSIPFFNFQIGPGSLSAYVGAKPTFARETVWFEPTFHDIRSAQVPPLDPDNAYRRWTLDVARRGAEEFRGLAMLQFPYILENLDILAALRGTQNLLLDLLEHPEDVHRLQRQILDAYLVCYDELYEILKDESGGCFYRAYGAGKTDMLACDFSAMIGPKMFREFVAPYLEEQADHMRNAAYHLDGPSAAQAHLDCLLGIDSIQCIQWSPGARDEQVGSRKWYGLYRRVLDAGKSLMLCNPEPDEVRAVVREFGPRGIYCSEIYVDDMREAERLVKDVTS